MTKSRNTPNGDIESLIRSELFSIERLEQHAESLAIAQRVTARPRIRRSLEGRLRENDKILRQAYLGMTAAVLEGRAIPPAAEWLIDNYFILEEQIRDIRNDLPPGFYRELPKLSDGPLEGYPRVFGIAWAFVAHTDSRFDPEGLASFVRAYQRVTTLSIGELWAVAITLRVVLVENMRRASIQIIKGRIARAEADKIADRLIASLSEPGSDALEEANRRIDESPLPPAFVVQLVQRLRDQDQRLAAILRRLDERIQAHGATAEDIVRAEHQDQGAMTVTVGNVITSMRLISATDWAEFFESVSLVDGILRAGSYFGEMDFPSRDLYRRAIERLARRSSFTEIEIAERLIETIKTGNDARIPDMLELAREQDPGYFLISKGRADFERALSYRPTFKERMIRAHARYRISAYIVAIEIIVTLIIGLALLGTVFPSISRHLLILLMSVALLPAWEAAVALVNRAVIDQFAPHILPGLRLTEGIPEDLRTMVVVPTLLTSVVSIEEQIRQLEVHHLASPDGDLRFALLSDWTDADRESMPEDAALLAAAETGIGHLNQRYASRNGPLFFLFHRRRVWNPAQGKWLGWERKRGKLAEFNKLLRGAKDTTFITGDNNAADLLRKVRYVITLDADTRLPRGAAKKLVGKMVHPLNRPRHDAASGMVLEGYGILQPRVSSSLPQGHEGSPFQKIFSNARGIDPYAFAVSDVYQDLFEEGSFSGKGIYDVDAFETALKGRIPENAILSHDLLEGIFARAGFASDVEVIEEYPSRYDAAAARQHRWARGDWQLLPWILGKSSSGISSVGRWKMLDNLRRSMTMLAAFFALFLGWTLPADAAFLWTIFIVAMLSTPILLPFVEGILPRRAGISKTNHYFVVAGDALRSMSQILLLIAFLPHQAVLMGDAIMRTLYRLLISRKHLLDWVSAAQMKSNRHLDIAGFYRYMSGGLWLSLAGCLFLMAVHAHGWPVAVPFALLWMFSPLLAWRISIEPRAVRARALNPQTEKILRLAARRTWHFFETFVTPADNMLPPDNFQEDPFPVVAHRTSPTNIGLYLLSAAAARDFGWAGTWDTAERIGATLDTLSRMDRFRGHFYNWYDTKDLRPLDPKYVSSVDSGNLVGHLIVLMQFCREIASQPAISKEWIGGASDALSLVRESLPSAAALRGQTVTRKQLEDALDITTETLMQAAASLTPAALAVEVGKAARAADTVVDIARTLKAEQSANQETAADFLSWAEAMRACIQSHQRDLDMFLPWAKISSVNLGHADLEEAFSRLLNGGIPRLRDLPQACDALAQILSGYRTNPGMVKSRAETLWMDGLAAALQRSAQNAKILQARLLALAAFNEAILRETEFGFLIDPTRQLLSIGYRIDDHSLDDSSYDLLASEARLASFVAIAKGDTAASHWFRLGRSMTPVGRGSVLISWSGSMFEYLMPTLVMRAPPESMLGLTNRLVVRRQVSYGVERAVPWGVSESAYNARDLEFTYQYSNFGVPGLGLKRGLSENVVIAPYATMLAAMIDPDLAVANLQRLAKVGGRGHYGWYEALDYTRKRLPKGDDVAIVRAYMAHHQGMSIVSIANVLKDGIMQARFHAEPMVQATELLLQELPPRDVAIARPRSEEVISAAPAREIVPPNFRRYRTPHGPIPRTHLLSNGSYAVMVTAAGGGYSRWQGIAVTRWREDATCDNWGSHIYIRDSASGAVWSAAYQPNCVEPDSYDVAFSEDRAEITRRDGTITTMLEVAVSPEHNGEVRRVTITNRGEQPRDLELTSYSEIALAAPAADNSHPAFSKLFVQTEYAEEVGALFATRRPRSQSESQIWAAHLAVVEGERIGDFQFETDRARFLGRGRDAGQPISIMDGRPLSNTVGTVLDPIFSMRCRLRIQPGASVRVAFWTLVATSRGEVLDLADKHRDTTAFDRAVTRAWTQALLEFQYLSIGAEEAHLYQELANYVIYSDSVLRPTSEVLKRGAFGPATLWSLGISGDIPIVLVRIDQADDLAIVKQLMRAHTYWGMKQLAVDLVVLNEKASSYLQDLQNELEALARANRSGPRGESEGVKGNIFVLRGDLMAPEARALLQTAARAILYSRRGSLSEQMSLLPRDRAIAPMTRRRLAPSSHPAPAITYPALEFFNGLGGFDQDGQEYVITLNQGQWTPLPWVNVIANPGFGFLASADGGGYSWAINSRENQLTPWSNDPVSDRPGEVLYVRDSQSGALWTPTALPIRENEPYTIAHGQGYSRFRHVSHGIELELTQYVPIDEPIKISRLKITDHSGQPRRLDVTAYAEWVLGTSRANSAPFIVTEIDAETGAMLARNPWSSMFAERVAFADFSGMQSSWTGDRREFLGRNGRLENPAALATDRPLSNKVGAGLDPCSAMQTPVDLKAHGSRDVVFLIGQAASVDEARGLIQKYRQADLDLVLNNVKAYWDQALGVVQVKTPDRAFDIMQNRWLLYQTLASRVWARAGFYQLSGAYGYRDQIQDTMALVLTKPELTRQHLLRAASRQFPEGDVQHWWLPSGKMAGLGVRTRISDDTVWLAYAAAYYVRTTGDTAVLSEMAPFIEGPILKPEEHESFFAPVTSEKQASLFEHCALALDHSLTKGAHGLPLFGTGDWNDGMNRVGGEGRGESVWLGWFTLAAIDAFAPLAEARGEHERVKTWRDYAVALRNAIEQNAWDGQWYRRGYFDDGMPLGSVSSSECRIDSIAQSWAVISGHGDKERCQRAMTAVEQNLIRYDDGLALLFTPPFDQTPLDPGYIKGYPPGIRENGGQYTHAALWSVVAFALMNEPDKAIGLLSMLNPINHASTRAATHRYKAEPYVVAADIYGNPQHSGRAGWTWYTGSASWTYRTGLEYILGFRVENDRLYLKPCIPGFWPGFELTYKYRSASYHIVVENHGGQKAVIMEIDGRKMQDNPAFITLADDGKRHIVNVMI